MMSREDSTEQPGDLTWKRLSKDEKDHLRRIMRKPLAPGYLSASEKCDSQMLVLLVMGELAASLTIDEITHMVAARYGGTADAAVVGRKIGQSIRAGLVRETPGRRYALTPDGQARVAKVVK